MPSILAYGNRESVTIEQFQGLFEALGLTGVHRKLHQPMQAVTDLGVVLMVRIFHVCSPGPPIRRNREIFDPPRDCQR